jgi:hypothetical protein
LPNIYINELDATKTFYDPEFYDDEDHIELYNAESYDVHITNYYVVDNNNWMRIPPITCNTSTDDTINFYSPELLPWYDSELDSNPFEPLPLECESGESASIIFTEIQAKAGESNEWGEWVELTNKTSEAIDLSLWRFRTDTQNNVNFTICAEQCLDGSEYDVNNENCCMLPSQASMVLYQFDKINIHNHLNVDYYQEHYAQGDPENHHIDGDGDILLLEEPSGFFQWAEHVKIDFVIGASNEYGFWADVSSKRSFMLKHPDCKQSMASSWARSVADCDTSCPGSTCDTDTEDPYEYHCRRPGTYYGGFMQPISSGVCNGGPNYNFIGNPDDIQGVGSEWEPSVNCTDSSQCNQYYIPANGHIILWADDESETCGCTTGDCVMEQGVYETPGVGTWVCKDIHLGLKLSSGGEYLALFGSGGGECIGGMCPDGATSCDVDQNMPKTDSSSQFSKYFNYTCAIDSVNYPNLDNSILYGRTMDGSSTWTSFDCSGDNNECSPGCPNGSGFQDLIWPYESCHEVEGVIGDINQDGQLNVVDIVLLVSEILNGPTPEFNLALADMNQDGMLNVVDIVLLVQNILNPTSAQLNEFENRLKTKVINLKSNYKMRTDKGRPANVTLSTVGNRGRVMRESARKLYNKGVKAVKGANTGRRRGINRDIRRKKYLRRTSR